TSGTAIVLHWNGKRWENLLRRRGELPAVLALSASNVWVVGAAFLIGRMLELHWNGERWTTYSQRWPGAVSPTLRAITDAGADGSWAGGEGGDPGEPAWPVSALVRWTGAGWRRSPPPKSRSVESVVMRVPGDLWLATFSGNGDGYGQPLLERLDGTHW